MNPEDRIRAAFSELRHRVPDQPTRPPHPAGVRRLVPALTGIATVTAIGLLAWQILPGERPVTGPSTETTTSSVTTPGVESTPVTTVTTQPIGGQVNRYRVDTEKVLADTSDPYLNLRHDPTADSPIVAKLPPTYTGLVRAGEITAGPGGGEWMRVSLKDPVQILSTDTTEDRVVYGWVNTAFVEPLPEGLPVTLAEIPACTGETTGITEPAGSRPPENVYALESGLVAEDCLRIVLTFGAGDVAYDWIGASDETGPANYLPTIQELQSRQPYTLDLGDIAAVNPTATDTPDRVYIVRTADLTVQMWAPLPVTESTVWGLNERGIVVIDLRLDIEATPPAGALVALTQQPLISNGSISVTGITRAFEANLGVVIKDENGNPVETLYSGSTFLGTIRSDGYAIQTIDWTETWAPFAVQAEGLEPGDYTLVLDAQGGADDPVTLDIPFTITDPGDPADPPGARANQTAIAMVGFGQGGTAPRFDETVDIRLGDTKTVTRSGADLANRVGWVIETDMFAGYSGPFDILAIIANRPFVRVTEGVRPRCAGAAVDYWSGVTLAGPPINLEPVGIDSCLQWYRVSLVVTPDDAISEVVLDLWEP